PSGACSTGTHCPYHTGDRYSYSSSPGSFSYSYDVVVGAPKTVAGIPGTVVPLDFFQRGQRTSTEYRGVSDTQVLGYGFDGFDAKGNAASTTRYNPPEVKKCLLQGETFAQTLVET